MSIQYDVYLRIHKENVKKGFDWLKENLPKITDTVKYDLEWQIGLAHDTSKSKPEEYYAYDSYFYGNNKSYQVVEDFRRAWLLHIHNNPHHWQYWVLHNDDPSEGQIIMDMPYNYIIEMVCDWWSFSWKLGNLFEIFNWYDEHKDYILLSDQTRKTVEDILKQIKEKLEGNES